MQGYHTVRTNEEPPETNTERKKMPYTFSENEKIFFMLSVVTLFSGVILFRETDILFSEAKPRLEETAHAIENYCTASATGAVKMIFDHCVGSNNTAVFYDLGSANGISPALSKNNTLPIPIQFVHSWFNPIAWINFFTCQNNQAENILKMTGHVFSGTPAIVLEKASNGFSVITANISTIPTPLFGIGNKTIQPALEMFLAGFCILLQNGGYSPYRNEHFNGFERFAESFGKYADRFAIVYISLMIAASLIALTLSCKKAVSNCHFTLFKTQNENQNHSIQVRTKEPDATNNRSPE